MAVELIVVGASWGGLHAMSQLLAGLPEDFEPPIALAQHRAPQAPDLLVASLQRTTARPVREAEDKDPVEAGVVYVAPADYHLLIGPTGFELSVDERVQHARPSIDVLFESAAENYGPRLIGVLLTGANPDGTAGLGRIRAEGGSTVVQDPADATSPRMPQAAITAGVADRVVPLAAMATTLVGAWRAGRLVAPRGAA